MRSAVIVPTKGLIEPSKPGQCSGDRAMSAADVTTAERRRAQRTPIRGIRSAALCMLATQTSLCRGHPPQRIGWRCRRFSWPKSNSCESGSPSGGFSTLGNVSGAGDPNLPTQGQLFIASAIDFFMKPSKFGMQMASIVSLAIPASGPLPLASSYSASARLALPVPFWWVTPL